MGWPEAVTTPAKAGIKARIKVPKSRITSRASTIQPTRGLMMILLIKTVTTTPNTVSTPPEEKEEPKLSSKAQRTSTPAKETNRRTGARRFS